jgi:hypothetical protein
MYFFGLAGYMSVVSGMASNIQSGNINFADIKKKCKTIFSGKY